MRMARAVGIALLFLGLAGSAGAAPGTPAAPDTTKAAAPAPKRDARHNAGRLEDIHIEGEIPVPQVLFVSGRDQQRYLDFQHRRYLRSSLAIGQETILPARITWIGPAPVPARKEIAP